MTPDKSKAEALFREGKRTALSLTHGVQAAAEGKLLTGLLEHYDINIIQNEKIQAVESVLFVLTRMVRFAGGQTSILRLGTELSKLGIRVGYGVYKQQSKEEMQICCESNLPGFQGELYTRQELIRMVKHPENQPDAVVASSWDTVYYVKKFSCYRMYFVQDFEPYFYTYGEKYLMAKKTYEQGLHMVSLGSWNREEIQKHCRLHSEIDVIDFPCDTAGYPYEERDFDAYPGKKKLVFAVYMKYYGKRLPNIIQQMLVKLKEELLLRDGIELEVRYYGEAQCFVPKGGKNLGMLTQAELSRLYRTADFGMVASLSNISLVPYEMLASGLPLIEFEDGTFRHFFKEDCALLTEISWKDLYVKLKATLADPGLLQKRNENAKAVLDQLSWEKSAGQFLQILQKAHD